MGLLIKRYLEGDKAQTDEKTIYSYDILGQRILAVTKNNLGYADSTIWKDFENGKPKQYFYYFKGTNGYYLAKYCKLTYDERMNITQILTAYLPTNTAFPVFFTSYEGTYDYSIPYVIFNDLPDSQEPSFNLGLYNTDFVLSRKFYSQGIGFTNSLDNSIVKTVQKDSQGYPINILVTTITNGVQKTSTEVYQWE